MGGGPGAGSGSPDRWAPPDPASAHPPTPTPPKSRNPRTWTLIGVVVAAVVLVVGLVVVTQRDGDDDGADSTEPPVTAAAAEPTDTSADAAESTVAVTEPPATTAPPTTLPPTTTTDPGFVQAEGEIFLEPAESEGPDSFAGELFVTETTLPPAQPTTTVAITPDLGAPSEVSSVVGDTPALYGGTQNSARCDKEAQLAFLQANPDKAAAFAEALSGDPTLRWSWGVTLSAAQLPDYFAELTPVVLTSDTRVTNHGYRDGRPTSRQVVLQAGTAVLVDAYGVPRARCLCGNPLTAPLPVQVAPVYTGVPWPGFDPATVIVVNATTVVIDGFVLVDVTTGEEFVRPGGSDGYVDGVPEASGWYIDAYVREAAVDYYFTVTASWSGELGIAGDGTVTGTAFGTWTFDADCYEESGDVQSTSSAFGSFVVTLTGEAVTTELGQFASIQPMYDGFTIDGYEGNPPVEECEFDIYDHVESWVAPAFGPIEIQAANEPVTAAYESADFFGEVVLTPIGWESEDVPAIGPGVWIPDPMPAPGEPFAVDIEGCLPEEAFSLEFNGALSTVVADEFGWAAVTLTAPPDPGPYFGSVSCNGATTNFEITVVS